MVNFLIFLFLLLPPFLFSGEFAASIKRNQINLGESFTLSLTLKDASPYGNPAIESLNGSFIVSSQQQSTNAMLMNGHITSSTTWMIALAPKKEGEAMIPPISINTSEGVLTSAPIRVNVVRGGAASPNTSNTNETILTSYISQPNPYKNEPLFYTVKLSSKSDLANVKIQQLNIEDAIVESNGDPKIIKTIIDGVKVNIVEWSYLITPLKAGSLNIPSIIVQGGTPVRSKAGSLFDDDSEPLFMMMGFNRLKPFALATKEIPLEVQPVIAGMNPWIPARSLKIEEIWNDSQTLQTGEPIIRGFKIHAEGVMSNQLPSLKDLQISDNGFKIYADKPETGDEIKEGSIHSFRKEQYTLIPQQSGTLTLPEISVAWWDVAKKEKIITRVPSRILQITPAPEHASGQDDQIAEKNSNTELFQAGSIQRDPLLYVFMAGLAILLFVAIFWVVALQNKIARLTEKPREAKIAAPPKLPPKAIVKQPPKEKREKLPDLNPT